MTHDEHQMARRLAWIHVAAHTDTDNADYMLAAFDKRFPAPVEPVAEAATQTPAEDYVNRSYSRGYHDGAQSVMQGMPTIAELDTLRQKARLYDKLCSELGTLKKKAEFWDALASRKVRLVAGIGAQSVWWADYGTKPGNYTDCTRNFHTAAEAVQAAIDAGALK